MTITGTVHHIGPVESVGDKGFTKRLLVVRTDQQYDNLIPVELKKDKTALADGLKVGQSVTVHTNIGGREYNGKYYTSITGWKIEADQSAPPQNQSAPVAKQSAPPVDDDLPF
jgi:single-strand DNA-binding protein